MSLRDKTKEIPFAESLAYFVRWTIIAIAIGGIGGFAGACFAKCVVFVTELRGSNNWTLYLMPVAGLIIVWLYQICHEEKNRGTNMVIEAISSDEEVTAATGPLIFISTVLTHLVGGSSGREGAALQLGGSIGSVIGRVIKLDEKDKKIAVMCGMSAVFGALFGTPIAAGVFSMEVISIGVLYYAALVPCLFSSFIGTGISRLMGVPAEHYTILNIPEFGFHSIAIMVVLGMLCAVVSIGLCTLLHNAERIYRKFFPNAYVRVLAASLIFIVLTLAVGHRDYCGGSLPLIEKAIEGHTRYVDFFLKALFTAIALGGGFRGGEIVPTLCVGATFGCAVGMFFGISPSLFAACGMAALFAGVTNCPVSTLIIALEMFGDSAMPYLSIVIAISFTLSGYYGLYSSQKFVYSKTKTEYINRKSNH